MDLIGDNCTIDPILNSFKKDLGKDFEQYRNHVYRVFNFAIPFVNSEREIEILSIGAAFHDLGIWTGKTFDYLEPSIELVRKYADIHHLNSDMVDEIEILINEHHKLTRIKTSVLAEIFRQADLVDLSLGLIRCGREKRVIKRVRKAFPNKGFHFYLLKLFLLHFIKHPLNPLPMYQF